MIPREPMWRVRRLHVQFYLAILATLTLLALGTALSLHLGGMSRDEMWSLDTAAQLAETLLPPAAASSAEQQRALDLVRERLRVDLALYDRNDRLLGRAGHVPPLDARRLARKGWTFSHGPLWILELADGRRLAVRPQHLRGASGVHVFTVPLALVLAFALGAYPIARRLTRRLARLQKGVEQLGTGDLSARVPVEGHDEVAALASSLNASAERIEVLVRSHKLLLANCSHELRTPLARIRLGLERVTGESDPALRNELTRSIAELDELIGEMLLFSRLDALRTVERAEEVDLLALVAEEAAQFDRTVEGRPVIIKGDPALLRRLVRNLLDNAQRYAGGATRVHVDRNAAGDAELIVEDRGPGIPATEREKIFEPFYRSAGEKAPVKGFGLGLALVRQIARAHGGDVCLASVSGSENGSRFIVTLSCAA